VANGETYRHYVEYAAMFGYKVSDLFDMVDKHFEVENGTYIWSNDGILEYGSDSVHQVYRAGQTIMDEHGKITKTTFKSIFGDKYTQITNDPIAAMLIDVHVEHSKSKER